jgi:Cu(I)/Ag(I) efflux system membrane protein CusA/SilA
LNIAEVQNVIAAGVGGSNVSQTIEGLERYPINLRYPEAYRDSPEQLMRLPIISRTGELLSLGDVARVYVDDGPAVIKSENARLNGLVYIDIEGVDIGEYVQRAQQIIDRDLKLPAAYSLQWAGQYEYIQRAAEKLSYVVPFTLAIIIVLLYLSFRRMAEVLIILLTLPLAMTGGLWLMYGMGFNFSVAAGVGFIALAGVAVEIGVIMLVYLNQACRPELAGATQVERDSCDVRDVRGLVLAGASLRLRPVMMTAMAIVAGLVPILLGEGTGSEVMSRIAAPMVGGMVSAVILTLLVLPVVYLLSQSAGFKRAES